MLKQFRFLFLFFLLAFFAAFFLVLFLSKVFLIFRFSAFLFFRKIKLNLQQIKSWRYIMVDLGRLIDFFIFILLSRESGGGAIRRTNPDSLRSCLCFYVFRLNFLLTCLIYCLPDSIKQRLIIVKHLIQGHNNETRLGVEPLTLRSWSS